MLIFEKYHLPEVPGNMAQLKEEPQEDAWVEVETEPKPAVTLL